jgi:hypothetical protein
MLDGIRIRLLEAGITATLVGLIVGELLIYAPPIQRAAEAGSLGVAVERVTTSSNSGSLHLKVTYGASDQELRLVTFPLSGPTTTRSIFVFDDARYPTAGVSSTSVQGVFDHLKGELSIRRYPQPILELTAEGLRDVLRATDQAKGRAVVVMTGAFPSEVLSRTVNLVSPWVTGGGLIVWGGAPIGYYSGTRGQPLAAGAAGPSLREKGPELLLGKGAIRFPWAPQRIADTPSGFATGLDIGYQFASAGVVTRAALAQGGQILGPTVGPFSSVTYLPHGQGGYLVFGGEILDEVSVAYDLAQLLLSNVLYAKGPIAVKRVRLHDLAPSSVVTWNLPFAGNGPEMIVAFDPSPDAVFYYAKLIAR